MADIRRVVESVMGRGELDTEIRNQAIRALVKYRDENRIRGNCPSDVDSALSWGDTDEGISFWRNIHNEIHTDIHW